MKKILYITLLFISVFLVNEIKAYTAYKIGDVVTYNNVGYYVIKNSDNNDATLTLLKTEPLTVEEVNQYGIGHINRNTSSSVGTAYNANGYGGMAYYSSDLCNLSVQSGCTNSYEDSDIKYVVDAWAQTNTVDSDLAVDLTGYSARLLTYEELITNLGYSAAEPDVTTMDLNIESVPDWVYNSNYWYWTMSQYQDEMIRVWRVGGSGNVDALSVYDNVGRIVRPVIVLKKTALGDKDESIDDNIENIKQENDSINEKISKQVNVPNTYLNSSLIIIIIGFVIAGVGIVIYYKLKKRESK